MSNRAGRVLEKRTTGRRPTGRGELRPSSFPPKLPKVTDGSGDPPGNPKLPLSDVAELAEASSGPFDNHPEIDS